MQDDPRCNKCGHEITTGMMAVFCPQAESCEFWPADKDSQDFIRDLQEGDSRAAKDIKEASNG